MSWLRTGALMIIALLPLTAGDYPALTPPADPAALGLGIQRTMTLLATSTPQHRNHVRVLFYGQSITEQAWSKQVADDLRQRFPNADLEIENRAIGGFASQLLIWPAEHDLYPFYPDLLIFHVYGSNKEYEDIIRNVRTRTAAEVLMQTDHANLWPLVITNGDELKKADKEDHAGWWSHMMNKVFLPDYAKRYGCGLCDVRSAWVDYLKANNLEPKALLKDGVHLNDHGCFVMASIISRYLVYRPELPKDGWQDLVKDVAVGKDASFSGRTLSVEVEGNRIDVVGGPSAAPLTARFLIDGKKPSEYPACHAITRSKPGPWSALFLCRVDHDAALLNEDWTLTITKVSQDMKSWSYDVRGSLTGADGSGDNSANFHSPSGRVLIDAKAWFRGPSALKAGYVISWTVKPLAQDSAEITQGDQAKDQLTTIAQGLANGTHTLEITTDSDPGTAIRAIRVYRPAVR
jgi:hypothetical protein